MIGVLLFLAGSGLFSDDAVERAEAVVALKKQYTKEVGKVPLLVGMLRDDNALVRGNAANVLAAWGAVALSEWTEFVADEKDPAMPSFLYAGKSLSMMGAAVTPSDFCHLLGSTRAELRKAGAALSVLAPYISPRYDELFDVLADGGPARATGLALLGWAKAANVRPLADGKALRELDKSKVPLVRYLAVTLIVGLRADDDATIQHLEKLKSGDDINNAAEHALRVFGKLPQRKADLERLKEMLAKDTWRNALWELRDLGERAAPLRDALFERFKAAKGDDLALAGVTLAAISPKLRGAVIAKLAPLLESGTGVSKAPKLMILRAIEESGSEAQAALPALIGVLGLREPQYKKSAASRLAKYGDAFNYEIRAKRSAVRTLGNLGATAASSSADLRTLGEHTDLRLRYLAGLTLRKIGR